MNPTEICGMLALCTAAQENFVRFPRPHVWRKVAFNCKHIISRLKFAALMPRYKAGAVAYEPKKAAQLIAYLILKTGGQTLNVLKAVKLVYLVDRESIAKFGFPVLDEKRCSLPHGPVNSLTYSYIAGDYDPDQSGWSDFLRDRENHNVALARQDIDVNALDELSDADIACADAVWDRFGAMDQWQLRDWTHQPQNIPEWEDPNGGSTEIPLQRILNAVGVEGAEDFTEVVESYRLIDRAFENARVH